METRVLRAACYVRCSTAKKSVHSTSDRVVYEQNPDVQEQLLRKMVEARGWELAGVYSDRASGSKESRPGLDALMADARRRKFDCLVIFRLDRLARSLKQLVDILTEFRHLHIAFVSHQENLDTESPAGKVLFALIAAMSEFEHDILRERIAAGMAHASKHGTKSGRPPGRPKVVFDRGRVVELRDRGWSWSEIAKELGANISTARVAYREAVKRLGIREPGER